MPRRHPHAWNRNPNTLKLVPFCWLIFATLFLERLFYHFFAPLSSTISCGLLIKRNTREFF